MNKQLRMQNTSTYKYVNVNPKNKYVGDCVVRAIANALNQSWETTVREMTDLGIKKGLLLNDDKLYPLYLESKGFIQCKEPRDYYDNTKMSVNNFLMLENPTHTIVANVGSHHVTCIKDGMVEDTWDCSKKTMHKYWKKI